MARGNVPKREAKKPKKKNDKRAAVTSPVIAPEAVEIIRKRRKPRDEEQ